MKGQNMSSNIDEERKNLIEALSSGDDNAFRTIFLNYFPKVKGFIGHLLKNEIIAEDLSQEIFVSLWGKRKNPIF